MIMMSTTIQQVLRPLFLMCFIMGLGVYPIKKLKSRFQWILYLSILYFSTIWFVYGYVVFYTFTIFSPKILFTTTVIIVIMMANLIGILSGISFFYYQKRFQILMKKLDAVNNTLAKLGTLKTYQELYIILKRVIIGWIMYVFIINIYTIMWWSKYVKVSWEILLLNTINYPFYIIEFIEIIFNFVLWYIGTEFDKINNHMQCLLLKKEHGLKCMWKKNFLHRHNYKRILWTSMHLHLELCRIARELNMIFGMQITFGIAYYLGWSIIHCYYVCRMFGGLKQNKIFTDDYIGHSFWFLICFIKLCVINHISESIKNKANNIYIITHQLTNNLRYADIWNEMYFFVFQVMQHPLKFTGLGLFYLGYKFFLKVSATIVTFVIIMVQLKVQ